MEIAHGRAGSGRTETRTAGIEPRVNEDDEELVARSLGGDTAAFGELVDRYQARLVRYVRGVVGNEEDARDVAQEVFVRVYTHLDRFDPARSFAVWLFGIASHVAIDWLRRRKRRAGLDEKAPAPRCGP